VCATWSTARFGRRRREVHGRERVSHGARAAAQGRGRNDGARLARDRKRIAFDRLLARLAATGPERWLLKGGFALELRLRGRARATKDVDLEWQTDGEELLDALIDAAEHDAGDYFTFLVERTGPSPDRLGGSQRFRVSAALAGRPFEQHFLLDIAPREDTDRETVHLTTPSLLAFAGIEPVTIAAIPLERHLAEKLHAYTRTFDDGRENTRVKDLIDLALIAELEQLDAAALRDAIDHAFLSRRMQTLPDRLPSPHAAWTVPYSALAQATGISTDLAAGHAAAAALLDPILTAHITTGRWDPYERRWTTPRLP
jgi:Nucleotidyl transferase AbiEii toxin, Type IV TA system